MVDFPHDESLMTAGLDAWPDAHGSCPPDWLVVEERLQARLGVGHLRLPPEYREPGPGVRHAGLSIPVVRFPRWHYCPRSGGMTVLPLFGGSRERCRCGAGTRCGPFTPNRRPFVIPVRIIAACDHGHIQDFPFMEWVHNGVTFDAGHELRYQAGRGSASLSGIRIECSCGRSRTLAGSFDYDVRTGSALDRVGVSCRGLRPWLGETEVHAPCGRSLRVLQRGASNVYFPHTISSIYLPLWAEQTDSDIVAALESPGVWTSLTDGLEEGRYVSAVRCDAVGMVFGLDPKKLRAAAQRKLDGGDSASPPASEEEFRRQEYDAIREGRGGDGTDLLVEVRDVAEYTGDLSQVLRRVGLVRKLRETRVLAGFTRVVPVGGGDGVAGSGRAAPLQQLSLRPRGWLPAVIVRGEGIFLEFQHEAIETWLSSGGPAQRVAGLIGTYNARRRERLQSPRELTPKFLLLHTLAHLLIRQLGYECGYGSASLRERIYCDVGEDSAPMQGILLYTASGDSEGSMGGLVRQGEPGRLEVSLLEAVRAAEWCSSDPVCLESAGQGADNTNLAACHGCALLSETSCEEGNRLLDRALVVGSLSSPGLGFLSWMRHLGSDRRSASQ